MPAWPQASAAASSRSSTRGSPLTASAGSAMRPAGPDLGRRVEDIGARTVAALDRCSRGLRPVDADSGRFARDRRDPASVDDGARSASRFARSTTPGARAPRRPTATMRAIWSSMASCASFRSGLPSIRYAERSTGSRDWAMSATTICCSCGRALTALRERIPVRVAVQDRPTTALASRLVRTVGERQLRFASLISHGTRIAEDLTRRGLRGSLDLMGRGLRGSLNTPHGTRITRIG